MAHLTVVGPRLMDEVAYNDGICSCGLKAEMCLHV